MSLLGRLRGLPALLVRLTATALRVCPSNFTSDGDAESRYAPSGVPEPSTRTIHFVPPFLAGAKLPSAKHSSQRILSWSLSWAKKARHISSSTPLASHWRNLRQQVDGLPYSLGNSLHCAPVHRTHKIPSKQRRSSARGLPPLGLGLYRGRCTRSFSHCSSVSPLHDIQTNIHICSYPARRF